jgi:methyl-accepting chemotaxis protein
MKNLPIVAKFATLMAAFGAFTLCVAAYSASQMSHIDESYTDLLRHDSIAALALGKAEKGFENSRAAIGDLLMLTDDDLNAKAIKELTDAHDQFRREMDRAIAAAPTDKALPALRAEGLDVLDGLCKVTVEKAKTATAAADVTASQAIFLRDCQPLFPPLSAKISAASRQLEEHVAVRNLALSALSRETVSTTLQSSLPA